MLRLRPQPYNGPTNCQLNRLSKHLFMLRCRHRHTFQQPKVRTHECTTGSTAAFTAARSRTLCSRQQAANNTKKFDVVHLGNLCLDVIVPVAHLPPSDSGIRADLLRKLTARPPSEDSWEIGGAANFMVAAARLGQRVGCLGQIGDDVFGHFLNASLVEEGVDAVQPLTSSPDSDFVTLLCFVLIEPLSCHAFTSRYDFGPWPLLHHISDFEPDALQSSTAQYESEAHPEYDSQALSDTRALMLNGFVLDELPGPLVVAAASTTRAAGGAVFFDPGPRSWTLLEGERKVSLDAILDVSDVVLMTQEEAEAITGCSDPEAAGLQILARPTAATAWAIVKLGSDGAILCARGGGRPLRISGLKVPVRDTVGCGDSFAAAIALGYTRGQSADATLALANAVGAATAMSRGAGRGVASADTVLSLLRAQTAGFLQPCSEGDHNGETAIPVVTTTTQPSNGIGHQGTELGHNSSRDCNRDRRNEISIDDQKAVFDLQTPHVPAVQAIEILLNSLQNSKTVPKLL